MTNVKEINDEDMTKVAGGAKDPDAIVAWRLKELNRARDIIKDMTRDIFKITDSKLEKAIMLLQNRSYQETCDALFDLARYLGSQKYLNYDEMNKGSEVVSIANEAAHEIDIYIINF